jgi:hypothetical protein
VLDGVLRVAAAVEHSLAGPDPPTVQWVLLRSMRAEVCVQSALRQRGGRRVKRSVWLTFAGVVLIITGILRIFDAIWAFEYNGPVVDNLHRAFFGDSLTTYGVIWLVVGILLIIAGFLVLNPEGVGAEISRWFGVVASAVAAITAITWMPYYPIWSLLYVAIALIVIYGLVARFGEEPITET